MLPEGAVVSPFECRLTKALDILLPASFLKLIVTVE